MSDQEEALVKEFLVECNESLDKWDRDLVALEQDPDNQERLAVVFRTIHNVKGTCGFFGFSKLEKVSHSGESLLSRLRNGQLQLNPEITSSLLALGDAVRQILAAIDATGQEGSADYGPLIETLTRLQKGSSAAETRQAAPGVVVATQVIPPSSTAAGNGEPSADPAETSEAAATFVSAAGRGDGLVDGNIRVDVDRLDKLMDLVGELVLARNQILEFAATLENGAFLSTSQRLNLITSELQEGIMRTRMQPIGNVWSKYPRLVRDVSLVCNKQVRLEMEGKETELDKTIIEAIKDPLTHLIRNAIDHGIETPALRQERGKPAEGRIFLRAFHKSGQVNVEITDDGGGIDAARVRAKALERNLIRPEQVAGMSARDLLQLIFLPGFSTAPEVTSVSGRGVGMDVVKTNVEKVGGTIDLQTQPGHGTTVTIKIPLTLAIIPALLVTCAGDVYAIPQISLLELVRLDGDAARRGIERLHNVSVYRLRDRLLPLVYLNREFQVEETVSDTVNVVVLQANERPFGLVVDRIHDTAEIVVKPLRKSLKGIPHFAGATIMGDGRVALILDPLGIAKSARVVMHDRDLGVPERPVEPRQPRADVQSLLLIESGGARLAVPLALVVRLEEVPRSALARAAGMEVVHYRGTILPVIRLSQVLPDRSGDRPSERDPMHVVVCSDQGRQVGLLVDRIHDVIETEVELQHRDSCPGILGSAWIDHRVTDVVDLPTLARAAPRRGLAEVMDEIRHANSHEAITGAP